MKDTEQSKKGEAKTWNPAAQAGQEAAKREQRSLDSRESDQLAPGYYNQQSVNQPRRRTIDDDVVPPGRH